MEGYEVYKIYLALKLHFTKDNYNFFTFNGKSRASLSSFEKRNDRYFFKKLGKKFKLNHTIPGHFGTVLVFGYVGGKYKV